jgi:excisionase family DNA binding protein
MIEVLRAMLDSHLAAARSLEVAIRELERKEAENARREPKAAAPSPTAPPAGRSPSAKVLVDTVEAAARLGISARTLEKAPIYGGGPPYIRLGGLVRYGAQELEAWIAAHQRFASTSEADSSCTVAEACRLLKIDREEFLELVERKKVPTMGTGRSVRIKRSDLDRLL